MMRFESRIAGIPCQIEVKSIEVHRPYRGSAHTCDSDAEYYGYTDCEAEANKLRLTLNKTAFASAYDLRDSLALGE